MQSSAWRFTWGFLTAAAVVVLLASLAINRLVTPILEQEARFFVDRNLDKLAESYHSRGITGLKAELQAALAADEQQRSFLLVYNPESGEVLAGNIDITPHDYMFNGNWQQVSLRKRTGGLPVLAGMRGARLSGITWVLAGLEMDTYIRFQSIIRQVLAFSLLSLVLAGLAVGLLMSNFLQKRVQLIVDTADEIIQGDLSRRVPQQASGDEFDHMVSSLNMMIGRIEVLMTTTRSVTESVAHDFRSPLSRLKANLELGLHESAGPAQLRGSIEGALHEIDSLLKSLNALLEIARVEGNLNRDQMAPVDIRALVLDLCEFYKPLIEEKGMQLEASAAPVPLIRGHVALLTQALSNLLDNAVKFSSPGARITVTVGERNSAPFITVADEGPGIAPEYREYVLQRFTRLDQSRTTPGSGLGLNLVQVVARQHGATLSLQDNQPGLRVVLQFPNPVKLIKTLPPGSFTRG